MRTEKINDKRYFILNHEKDAHPDLTDIRILEQNGITGLLPFKYVRQEEERYFRYEAAGEETLLEWLARVQHKQDVMKLLESIIIISEELDAYLLEQARLCIEPGFVIVNGNQCQAAYIPLEQDTSESVLQMAQIIVFSVKYAVDEDFGYLFDLQNAFRRKDIQNRMDLRKWLRIVNGEEKSAGVQKEEVSAGQDAYIPAERPVQEQAAARSVRGMAGWNVFEKKEASEEAGNAANSLEGIFGDIGPVDGAKEKKKEKNSKKAEKEKGKEKERHGFFARNKKMQNVDVSAEYQQDVPAFKENPSPEKEIINNLDSGDMTRIIMITQTPTLVRTDNGTEYELTKEQYIIGSGTQADIVIADNKTVSRQHARIFQKNGSWYIEDMGSTNGTCVNGARLRHGEPCKLEGSIKIRISNVDHLFSEN